MTFSLTSALRFRAASSTVSFKDTDGEVLDNEVFKKSWANLEEGAVLTHVFSCDTPDLHLWKVVTPDVTFGVAVRNASHEKILAANPEA